MMIFFVICLYLSTLGFFLMYFLIDEMNKRTNERTNSLLPSSLRLFSSGYFCDNTLYAVSDLSNASCPAGYYCPAGTLRANEFPCPPGTYNNLTNAVNESSCTPAWMASSVRPLAEVSRRESATQGM